MDACAWLIPFLDLHMLRQSSPFWDSRSKDGGHPSPWMLHRTLEMIKPASLGMAVQPTQTSLNNLLLCGPEVIPGLGIEGEALSAQQAVERIESHKKIKKII
jgi:hypothetical protein